MGEHTLMLNTVNCICQTLHSNNPRVLVDACIKVHISTCRYVSKSRLPHRPARLGLSYLAHGPHLGEDPTLSTTRSYRPAYHAPVLFIKRMELCSIVRCDEEVPAADVRYLPRVPMRFSSSN